MREKMILMIVDDDSDDCEFFCEAVNEIDPLIECFIAKNGEEALKMLRAEIKELPDFIFLDLNMPRMNGKVCLAELKKDPILKNISVIIYTTSSSQKDIDETKSLGANGFVTKPCDFKDLRKRIITVTGLDKAA